MSYETFGSVARADAGKALRTAKVVIAARFTICFRNARLMSIRFGRRALLSKH